MNSLLISLLQYFISPIISLLIIVMFVYMAFSWLIAFNIVNLRNPAMAQLYTVCQRLIEPILTPIRRFIPPMGGLDLAFLVAFLGLSWLNGYVVPRLIFMLSKGTVA